MGGDTYLGNVINGDNVLVGMLIRLVDDGLDGSGIVLAWHCGWWCCCCCWYVVVRDVVDSRVG